MTLAVERRVSRASESLWDEAWMRTGEERRQRSRLPSPTQPETTILRGKPENEPRNDELFDQHRCEARTGPTCRRKNSEMFRMLRVFVCRELSLRVFCIRKLLRSSIHINFVLLLSTRFARIASDWGSIRLHPNCSDKFHSNSGINLLKYLRRYLRR